MFLNFLFWGKLFCFLTAKTPCFKRRIKVELGKKIKALRHLCGLTQEELANRCELTKGYISQLENELTSPSIATLKDILLALGTTLNEFFKDEEEEKIIFKEDDFIEKQTCDFKLNWLVTNAQKNMMEPILVEINPHSKTESDFPHEGEEFGYVLSGSIIVNLGGKKYKCNKGESFYYTASKTHYVENVSDKPSKFIWVSTPPAF